MGSPMNDSRPREPQERELENLTQLFKILGDPSRMKVLLQIGPSEACVSEVADKLNMSESAVSHHIHILRMNGLVRWRRSGKAIYYVLKRLFSLRIDVYKRQTVCCHITCT